MNRDHVLSIIMADPNLQAQIRDKAVSLLNAAETFAEFRHKLSSLTSKNQLLLRGPKLEISPSAKLARVITEGSLSAFWPDASIPDRYIDDFSDVRDTLSYTRDLQSIRKWPLPSTSTGIVWATYGEAVEGLTADELAAGLGLTRIRAGEGLFTVTYRLAKAEIRIPTVLDALLDPSFVAKPRGTQDPRAWNWEKGDWGLPEFVHVDEQPMDPISLRFVGTLSRDAVLYDLSHFERAIGKPITDEVVRPQIVEASDQLVQRLTKNPELMYEISPRDFEKVIAELLSDMGWTVELTPQTRDGGFDVLARRETEVGPVFCLVEAKRYRRDRPVGVELVRTLYGTMTDKRATTSLLVTTSSFTEGARKFQSRNKYQINLRDYSDIVAWLREYSKSRS